VQAALKITKFSPEREISYRKAQALPQLISTEISSFEWEVLLEDLQYNMIL